MLFKASAPGRVSLLGEHAALHDFYTIVLAVNRRITIELKPRLDKIIQIESTLGEYQTHVDRLEVVSPFQFVLATLQQYKVYLKQGCTIHVSAFSDQLGLASSAAVTVALLAILNNWFSLKLSKLDMIQSARHIVRSVQGFGSGADVAVSVLGGAIAYQANPLIVLPLNFSHPFTVLYSGNKVKTSAVVQHVKRNFLAKPTLFKNIIQGIADCSEEGLKAIKKQDWQMVGDKMNQQHLLMNELGVSTPLLNHMVDILRSDPQIVGAKISGAGLGDCVIGLGKLSQPISISPGMQIDVTLDQGVVCEKI